MALPPKYAGQKFTASDAPSLHTIELYLDYLCPFSMKMFSTVYENVLPLIRSKYASKVQLIFRQQIQPWHPTSTLVHEAAIAVLRISPQAFWPFSHALFATAHTYYDVSVLNETRNVTYSRLAKTATSVGVNEDAVYKMLAIPEKASIDEGSIGGGLNVGNEVTADVKTLVKMNRLVGVHVTPTVIFNGVVEGAISSAFTGQQWGEWLEENCA